MKKTLALLLVVFTLVAQLSMVTVSADGATVTVENVTAAAGETVDVKVDLTGCAGFSNLMLDFDYDEDVLTLVSATNGISSVTPVMSQSTSVKPYTVFWDSPLADAVHTGTILTLKFDVAADAAPGTYDVTVDYSKGPNKNFVDGEDCNYNFDWDSLNLTYVDGGITIPAPVVPDEPATPSKPEVPEFVAPSGAYVKVEDYAEWANAGDTIDIKVDLGNCAGFSNLMLDFDYDASAMTLVSATNGISSVTPVMSQSTSVKPYTVFWDSPLADAVHTGTILTLQFKLADDIEPGKYDITVDYSKGPNKNFVDGEDCNYNFDWDSLNLSYYNGSIQVKGEDAPVVPDEPTAPVIPEFVAPAGAYVKVEDYAEWGKPGDTIDIKVDLGNCAGFSNLMLDFDYDASAMTLISATNGISSVTPVMSQSTSVKPYTVFWDSPLADAVYTGTILTLQFKLADNIAPGKYDITVDYSKGPNKNFVDGEDCNYNFDWDSLNLSYYNGSIQVEGDAPVVPTEYALDAVVAGNGVTVSAEGPAMEGKIIVALYNGNNKLAQVKIFDAAADLSHTFTKTGTKIKVMWWDGLLTAKPLCDCVELPLN